MSQLEVLSSRIGNDSDNYNKLQRYTNGYEGELRFSKLFDEKLKVNLIKLHDLKLRIHDSECQIDFLLITKHECIIFEIKNYRGNYKMVGNELTLMNGNEIDNPKNQLQRQKVRLIEFFKENKIQLRVSGKLVFINPSFTLYESKYDEEVILPGQLENYLEHLNRTVDPLDSYHHQIANTIKMNCLEKSIYERQIEFELSDVKKGITCAKCKSFMKIKTNSNNRYLVCSNCNNEESANKAIIKSIYDFSILFPDEKITVQKIYEFVDNVVTKKQIRNVISSELEKQGGSKNTFYIFKNVR